MLFVVGDGVICWCCLWLVMVFFVGVVVRKISGVGTTSQLHHYITLKTVLHHTTDNTTSYYKQHYTTLQTEKHHTTSNTAPHYKQHYTTSLCTTPHHATPHHTTPHHTTPHHTTPHHTTPHHTTPHHTTCRAYDMDSPTREGDKE